MENKGGRLEVRVERGKEVRGYGLEGRGMKFFVNVL
jgi:hypothetical protein